MDNFIFSVNVTLPIFLIILLGYILRRINFLNEEFVRVINRYVFVIALPVMLFRDIAGTDVREDMNIKFFLFCLFVTILMFGLVWLIARIVLRDKSMVGAFAQAGARGSAAILGVAFVENICGDIGMTPLMIVAAVPFFNILSVVILVFHANDETKDYGKIKSACINIAKNPIIIGILLGLLASLVHLKLPVIPDRTLHYIAQTATPMALLAVGAGFDTKQAIARLKPAVGATLIKLVGLPAVFLPIAYAMGFESSEMVAILIMLASPTTVSCYIMAKNMGHEGSFSSGVIMLTTLLSAFTMTGWLFLCRSMGLI